MSDPNTIMDPSATGADIAGSSNIGGDGTERFVGHTNKGHIDGPDAGSIDTGHHSNSHTSHHEVHRKHGILGGSDDESQRSPFWEAVNASKGKMLQGAAMFAGFATLLGLSTKFVLMAASTLNPLVAGAVGAAIAGAVWMAGNEFVKVYKAEKAKDDSRLNKFLDNAKGKLSHAKDRVQETAHDITHPTTREIGELGIVGGTLSSHLGTTGFLVELPEAAIEQGTQASKTVQSILEQGPKNARDQALTREASSAVERAEMAPETNSQVSV